MKLDKSHLSIILLLLLIHSVKDNMKYADFSQLHSSYDLRRMGVSMSAYFIHMYMLDKNKCIAVNIASEMIVQPDAPVISS